MAWPMSKSRYEHSYCTFLRLPATNVPYQGENFYRDAKKIKTLNRFKDTSQRNAKGDITKAAAYQSRDVPTARVEPNRYVSALST